MKHEGGFNNSKRDPGGATNYGISLRFLKNANIDPNGDHIIDIKDIKGLTKEVAEKIYEEEWWEKFGYDKILSAKVAAKVLDLSVWMGPSQSHKLVQAAVNRLNDKAIVVDGKLGKQSIAAINSSKEEELYKEISLNAEHFVINLCADRPFLSCYKIGWIRRALE